MMAHANFELPFKIHTNDNVYQFEYCLLKKQAYSIFSGNITDTKWKYIVIEKELLFKTLRI